MTSDELIALRGYAVYDPQGQRVGPLGQISIGDDIGEPGWIAVRTGRFLRDVRLVPLRARLEAQR